MQITLNVNNPLSDDQELQLITLDVTPEMKVELLQNAIEAKGIPVPAQHLWHNGKLIDDSTKSLQDLEITDGDMLALHIRETRANISPGQATQRPAGGSAGGSAGGGGRNAPQDPETLRLQILADPRLQSELQRINPPLAAAIHNPQQFSQMFQSSVGAQDNQRRERMRQIEELNSDSLNPESQAKIAEMIRQENVVENLQNAMEYNPESFGRVHMLYVDVKVNGVQVKALVDSGAQATIMSPACAERCNIMYLVDKRFAGVARGVGTANIIGRVHYTELQVGTKHLPAAFTVMEGKTVDLLLGLDILKGHQATIDFGRNKLIIQGEEVEFLGESEVPKETEEAVNQEPTVQGPGGTMIGARSGAVTQSAASSSAQPSSGATSAPGPSSESAGPSSSSAPAQTKPAPFPERDIKTLMDLGCDRQNAINALEATAGHVEMAAGLLFQG